MAPRVAGMPLNDAMDGEGAGERPTVVEDLEHRHHIGESLDERRVLEVLSGHELGNLGTDAGQLAEYRGTDSEFAGAPRRVGFTQSIDSEQFGAFAGNTNDEFGAVDPHNVVAVGDTSAEWSNRKVGPAPFDYTTNDGLDIVTHAERLSTYDYLDGMKFVLVRHGATEWSAAERHTGRTDLALTALGREQVANAKSNVLSAIDDPRDGPAITRWNELASERS